MKALILKESEGEYDDYRENITNVLLVPDDFDEEKERLLFYQIVNLPRKQDGSLKSRYYGQARSAYIVYLKKRFEEINFIETLTN